MLLSEPIFIHESAQRAFQSALDRVPGVVAIPLAVAPLRPGKEFLVTASAQDFFQLGVYYGYGVLLTLSTSGE